MKRAGYFYECADWYEPTFWTHCWGKQQHAHCGWKVILAVRDGKPYVWNANSAAYSKGLESSELIGPFETLDAAFVALELLGE